jgi:hypothetical protein
VKWNEGTSGLATLNLPAATTLPQQECKNNAAVAISNINTTNYYQFMWETNSVSQLKRELKAGQLKLPTLHLDKKQLWTRRCCFDNHCDRFIKCDEDALTEDLLIHLL